MIKHECRVRCNVYGTLYAPFYVNTTSLSVAMRCATAHATRIGMTPENDWHTNNDIVYYRFFKRNDNGNMHTINVKLVSV